MMEGEENILATIHYSSYTLNEDAANINFLKIIFKSTEFINQILKEVIFNI